MLKIAKMLAVLVAVSALAISAPSATAATYTWGGGAGDEYFTDGSWDQAGSPDHLDDVVITSGTPTTEWLMITTTDWNNSWWGQWEGAGRARGGKTMNFSNATLTTNDGLFMSYGGTSSWTQTSGTVDVGTLMIVGGYDYNGHQGNGTVNLSGGAIQMVTGSDRRLVFAGGTQLFNQSGGSVTASRLDVSPPWHQNVNGSYTMTGGTLTLTGTTMATIGGEAGTGWDFNFGGGDIYLGGDQRTIADEYWFNITGDPQLYRATHDPGPNVTHLWYIPEPASLALLLLGLPFVMRRRRRS